MKLNVLYIRATLNMDKSQYIFQIRRLLLNEFYSVFVTPKTNYRLLSQLFSVLSYTNDCRPRDLKHKSKNQNQEISRLII